MANALYYGDNLAILRNEIRSESVDLICLDPPFNSRQDYNVLFAEKDGTRSASQIMAFEDTWEWNTDAERAYQEIVEGGGRVADAMRAFRTFLGYSDMMAYLAMMAPRVIELHRVLKLTGSIYLHCDPTASHYLKILMDGVFGVASFRADIRWKRTSAHANASLNYAYVSDELLFYTKSDKWKWNPLFQKYDPEYIESHYGQMEADGRRFTTRDLTASMQRASSGQLYEWKGIRPVATRCWSFTKDKMEEFERAGFVYGKSGVPRLKLYLEKQPGTPASDLWADIPPVNSQAQERLGYPTQKPEALLERIIAASSNEADVVLDPFCGCGTAIVAAQNLKRNWIGIDVTHLAIGLIKKRLADKFGEAIRGTYGVYGEPTDLTGARKLAEDDKFQFEAWALSLVGARHAGVIRRGADQGIDGRIYFHDDKSGKTKQIILSVKGGGVTHSQVRDLRGVLDRESAEIGVFITLEEPTKPMLKEAATAGFYKSPFSGDFPRMQIITIEELLNDKTIQYPRMADATFKRAPKAGSRQAEKQDALQF